MEVQKSELTQKHTQQSQLLQHFWPAYAKLHNCQHRELQFFFFEQTKCFSTCFCIKERMPAASNKLGKTMGTRHIHLNIPEELEPSLPKLPNAPQCKALHQLFISLSGLRLKVYMLGVCLEQLLLSFLF